MQRPNMQRAPRTATCSLGANRVPCQRPAHLAAEHADIMPRIETGQHTSRTSRAAEKLESGGPGWRRTPNARPRCLLTFATSRDPKTGGRDLGCH